MKPRYSPIIPVFVVLSFAIPETARAQDKAFRYEVKEDEISGEQIRELFLIGDDLKSLLWAQTANGKTTLFVMPAKTIFPDDVSTDNKQMNVNISMRSTAMKAPIRSEWSMNWMNYKLAYTKLTDEQIMSLYAGNAITLQFDKAGQRYKFPTVGPQCDGLQEAVEKLLGREPVAAAE